MNDVAILKTWNALSIRQRIMAVLAVVAVIVSFTAFFIAANKERQALLFSGLEPAVAGEVAAELDASSTPYTIKGSAIYVPESQRDRLRMEMARQGLPASSGVGYELLDSLNGFSTTADMFDAAYWRAKEGELTRTILSIPSVRAARVHLGVTRQSAFRRQNNDKTASVTVDAPAGLSAEQARSVQYLTALAVANLSPDSVVVIDTQRGVIAGPGAPGSNLMGGNAEERASELEMSLTRLLEAHVGFGNARVNVAMDVDRESVAQTERVIDPDNRQVVSRTLSEERDTEESLAGAVTVASNLPTGDGAEDAEEAAAEPPVLRTRRKEQVTFTGTEIERVTQKAAGAINRLSVAVLINERFTVEDDGTRVPDPRSVEELEALEALVMSAAGLNQERGDSLTLRTLPFEETPVEPVAGASFVESQIMPRAIDIGQMVFLGIVTLVLALFVVKPMLTRAPQAQVTAEANPEKSHALPADAATMLTMLTEESPEDAAAILDAWFEEDHQTA